jgi:transcriptional regulator with XRE-family HTH domain
MKEEDVKYASTIGKRLAMLITFHGLNKAKLSKVLGCSSQQISQYCAGNQLLNSKSMILIRKNFGTPMLFWDPFEENYLQYLNPKVAGQTNTKLLEELKDAKAEIAKLKAKIELIDEGLSFQELVKQRNLREDDASTNHGDDTRHDGKVSNVEIVEKKLEKDLEKKQLVEK